MAGSLIKIDEEIVTSAVASVTLGGSNWDISYDVYMVIANNVQHTTTTGNLRIRLLSSSSPDTSANYDYSAKVLLSTGTFPNRAVTNGTEWDLELVGSASNRAFNINMYLFNFNSASEYSFVTMEESTYNQNGDFFGNQGGGVLTVAQVTNGIQFYFGNGNIDGGTFTLYGLKK